MRALTVRQPWAWAIAAGLKDLENRTWRLPADLVGEWIALHAGASPMSVPLPLAGVPGATPPEHLVLGAIVALVRFGATVDASDSQWWGGPLAWPVLEVRSLATPVPCRGMLGLWPVPDAAERQISAQSAWMSVNSHRLSR